MNFKFKKISIFIFLLFIGCKERESIIIEEVFLSNYFHGERVIIDSLKMSVKYSRKPITINKGEVFIIVGFPNHNNPIEIIIDNIKSYDDKLVIELHPIYKVLGGNLFSRNDSEFFHLSDSTQDQWLKECFKNHLKFYLYKTNYEVNTIKETKVTISRR